MKTKIATVLSIVGVLTAGSAAALVNTQILDSGPTESGASKAVLPPASTVALTVPEIDDLDLDEPDDSTTTSTSLPESSTTSSSTTTVAPAPEPTGFLTAFNVGEAGVVTVDVIDGQLVLVSAEPKSGWTVTKAEDDSNDDSDEDENEVEVYFESATVRVEFEAAFVDGQIVPRVESESLVAPTTVANAPAVNAPTTSVHHDDDDDDEYEDDDHDDHDEDDDHDDDDEDDDHDDDDEDERDDD